MDKPDRVGDVEKSKFRSIKAGGLFIIIVIGVRVINILIKSNLLQNQTKTPTAPAVKKPTEDLNTSKSVDPQENQRELMPWEEFAEHPKPFEPLIARARRIAYC